MSRCFRRAFQFDIDNQAQCCGLSLSTLTNGVSTIGKRGPEPSVDREAAHKLLSGR
jgi:hypothetical protein